MNKISNIQHILLSVICYLYLMLFIYAAVNKLIDFDNFQVQLAQSPLLSSFATSVSYFVPITEIAIAVLLCFEKTRKIGLYAGFSLMVMFTAYIIIMVNFSPFVPCSCGGILEKMSWNQHLIFNIVFVSLGLAGILILPVKSGTPPYYRLSIATATALCSFAVMVALFLLSEDIIHHRNNFTRRFPHHPALKVHGYDLEVNSYYIAGVDNGKVYLGNITAPLKMTVLDSTLKHKSVHVIAVPDKGSTYRSIRISVKAPYFFIADGLSPFIYRGLVADWAAKRWMQGAAYFNSFEPIDANSGAIKAISSEKRENALGMIAVNNEASVTISDRLLVKKADGIFDTNGYLIYNAQLDKLVYTYAYRNEYLIIDKTLRHKEIGNTIDTTRMADLNVRYVPSLKGHKMASTARPVNVTTATYGNYLFIKAARIGQYEQEDMWDEASIVDIYDLTNKSYVFSFYVYDEHKSKMKQFRVEGNRLYALAGKHLVIYEFEKGVFDKNKSRL